MELLDENNNKEITEDEVAHYLKSHSGFFLKRDDLLLELKLAHPTGQAVSLLERQVTLLRERNMDMRSRLNGLLGNADNNDQLFDQTKKLTLALIEAQGIDAIVNTFNHSLLNDFNLDFSNLTLFGNTEQHRAILSRMIPADDAHEKIAGLLKSNHATCGILRPEELEFLFADQAELVGSAAVVPLVLDEPLGVIAIGSKNPNHFSSNMGVVFLSYIAEVLNRLLPRHLQS